MCLNRPLRGDGGRTNKFSDHPRKGGIEKFRTIRGLVPTGSGGVVLNGIDTGAERFSIAEGSSTQHSALSGLIGNFPFPILNSRRGWG